MNDMSQTITESFKLAERRMEKIPPYPMFVDAALKFLQDNEGEYSNEMIGQNLALLLSTVWEAAKIQQANSLTSSCME